MRTIYVVFFTFIFMTGCFGQSSNSQSLLLNDVKFKILDKKFYNFLNTFPQKETPFNSKKNLIQSSRKINNIPQEYVIKYLFIKKSKMYYEISDYNSDEETISDVRKELTDYIPEIIIPTKNYLMIVYSNINGWEEYPNKYDHLITYSFSGKMLDSLVLINGNEEISSKHDEYVLINPTHFKIFKYDTNKENYTKKGDVIDKNGYLNICIVEEYEIDDNGKIKKIGTEKKYLKQENYNFYDPKKLPDDPMNEY